MPRKQYKLTQRDRLTQESPLTPDTLPGLISKALGNHYTSPGVAETQKLCSILNQWHAWFYEAQELREFNATVDEAAAAIETLQQVLPVIGKRRLAEAERGDQFAKWMADAARDLYQAVNKDPARITHRESLPDQAKDWRWLADALPVDIGNAMRPANPRWPSGYSKKGPLTRVLAAIIPHVSGEHPSAIAIGDQLILLAKSKRGHETG